MSRVILEYVPMGALLGKICPVESRKIAKK
jgi:hypothetical protein